MWKSTTVYTGSELVCFSFSRHTARLFRTLYTGILLI